MPQQKYKFSHLKVQYRDAVVPLHRSQYLGIFDIHPKNSRIMKFLSRLVFFSLLFVSAQVFGQQEFGTASFYSDDYQGRPTAYGVKYDMNELTTSHRTHPKGTLLRVTRLDNNKSVTVKVIDKGPWIKGRVVDLSRRAAIELDLINDGVAEVKVEVVGSVEFNSFQQT